MLVNMKISMNSPWKFDGRYPYKQPQLQHNDQNH